MSKRVASFSDYEPHRNAVRLHKASEIIGRDIVVVAATGSGKTYSIIHDSIRSAWNNPFIEKNFGLLVCAPTYKQLLPLLEDPIYEKLDRMNLVKRHSYNDHETELKNGGITYYRSLDNYEAISGLNVFKAVIDEACLVSEKGCDAVRTRLMRTNGTLIQITSPKGTSNHIYHRYYGADAKPNPYVIKLKYSIFDNPIMTQEAVDRYAATVDRLTYRQDVLAEWVNLTEARVYWAFDDQLNISREFFDAPETYIGLDYNIGKNAWIALRRKNTGELHVIHEGYGAKTTQDMAAQIKASFGENAIIIDDASGTIRQQGDAQTQRQILWQCGLRRTTSHSSNPKRVQRYAVLNAHFENGLGQRRLYIHPNCKRLIAELNNLCYKKNSDEPDSMEGKAGHITDALGYAIWYVSGGLPAFSINKAA